MTQAPLVLVVVLLIAFQITFFFNSFSSPAVKAALPMVVVLAIVATWSGVQVAYFSLDPHASFYDSLLTVSYLLIFVLALALIDSRKKLEVVAWVIAFSGVLQVLIKLTTDSSGTFINYNHFAGYLEMGIALAMGLMLARLDAGPSRSWREVARGWIKTLLGPKVVIRVFIIILIIGLILSRSRMGNTAFFGALFFSAVIGLVAFRQINRSAVVFFGSVLVLDVALMGAFFGFDKLRARFEQLNLAEDLRVVANETSVRMIVDHWATGVGLGAYNKVYPAYRDERMPSYLNEAHNDLLQFPAELGLPVSILLFLGVLYTLILAIKVQFRRRSQFMQAMGFAATMGIASILIHASAEFNLQRTSNSMTFMVLLAFPYLAWTLERNSRKGP